MNRVSQIFAWLDAWALTWGPVKFLVRLLVAEVEFLLWVATQ